MDFEPGAVGEGEQFGVVQQRVEVLNCLGLELAVQNEQVVSLWIFKTAPCHSLHYSLLPPPHYAFSQKILQFQAVWVEHFHFSPGPLEQGHVLVDECGFGGGGAEHDDSSLGSLPHHCHFVVHFFLLDLLAKHVLNYPQETLPVLRLQPAVKCLAKSLNYRFLLNFDCPAHDGEVESEELHGSEAEVILRAETELDGEIFEHGADLVGVDRGRSDA